MRERLENTIKKIETPDPELLEKAQVKLDDLTKPQGSLGRLEELAKQIVCITGDLSPSVNKKAVLVMAGDHGVVRDGVSAYPQEVTMQMVLNFLGGGAAINVLAKHIGAEVRVVDMGVAADIGHHPGLLDEKIARGTENMTEGPAMTEQQAVSALEAGIETAIMMIDNGYNIIATGDMGIGNTTSSSAITSVICNMRPEEVTGPGTGIDRDGLARKIKAIKKAISVNRPDPENGIDVLSKVGGFEIGGIAGVILGCAADRIPVVIDGFISSAGALIAYTIEPKCAGYMIPSHCSAEKGHRAALSHLGLSPLFDFDMRLGEGTGAAIGISITEAAVKILNEMATFGSAGVSKKLN
ncbi:MAG: nicotinate-nucleotide--dimethylbenzimidazole phosphoribosyltransferase [Actinobacteria bacterium]|nr:nicotinate-nucleotide--dimethylbenzimidazole phosphoribosyltransferase [Actinomycetota bacterium]